MSILLFLVCSNLQVVFAPTSTDLFSESDDDGWLSDIQDGRSPSIVRRRGSVVSQLARYYQESFVLVS